MWLHGCLWLYKDPLPLMAILGVPAAPLTGVDKDIAKLQGDVNILRVTKCWFINL